MKTTILAFILFIIFPAGTPCNTNTSNLSLDPYNDPIIERLASTAQAGDIEYNKKYGLILACTGTNLYISGAPDDKPGR